MGLVRGFVSGISVLLFSISAWAGSTIVGGSSVRIDDPLAQQLVAIVFDDDSICTGSILDDSHILTAAHCIEGFAGGRIVFSTGKVFEAKTGFYVRRIKTAKMDPGYPDDGQIDAGDGMGEFHDIAVLTFDGGLPPGFYPVKLLSYYDYFQVVVPHARVVLAGYGITAEKAEDQGTLRKVSSTFGWFSKHGINFYTKHEGKVSCDGDSGGPTLIKYNGEYYVVGVLSRSDCAEVGVYTPVYRQ